MLHSLRKTAVAQRLRTVAGSAALLCAVGVLATGAGCSKSEEQAAAPPTPAQPSTTPAAPVAPMEAIDSCTLLTSEEIQAVQGEALSSTKPTTHQVQGLAMYDCFFTLPTFTNSISLSITQSGPGADARDARQAWRETVAAATAKANAKVEPPKKIEGIGEEAFWTGDERIGALYVLQGPRYLRVSVGGPANQGSKIEKSRALAEVALKKL